MGIRTLTTLSEADRTQSQYVISVDFLGGRLYATPGDHPFHLTWDHEQAAAFRWYHKAIAARNGAFPNSGSIRRYVWNSKTGWVCDNP